MFSQKSFLQYQKKNDPKIFHSSAKLVANDLNIDEAYKSMHQSIIIEIPSYTSKDWVA